MRRQNETQASVAEFIGVSQPSVSNWLRDTMPRSEQIATLAKFFAVSVDDFVNHELPHRENIQALTELERELKELQSTWNAITQKLHERATNSAAQRDYSNAIQNHWMATGIQGCANDLSKILEVYFSSNAEGGKVEEQVTSDSRVESSVP